MSLPIRQVVVYRGHEKTALLGPYGENIKKRIGMFTDLNPFREAQGKKPWAVSTSSGEELIRTLKKHKPFETLLVIPAGQSSHLDKVFSAAQTRFLREVFFAKGGRGYFTCGAAYWASKTRIYHDVCLQHPKKGRPDPKKSIIPLFEGVAEGPLCPFPGHRYKVGFYSDAVEISDGKESCSVYLSGGGSFVVDGDHEQKVRILARYAHSELLRHGVEKSRLKQRENAAIMVSIGKGAAILAMFHPYYSSRDIHVEAYERAFPNCGTDWRRVHQKLSSFSVRMHFFLNRRCCINQAQPKRVAFLPPPTFLCDLPPLNNRHA